MSLNKLEGHTILKDLYADVCEWLKFAEAKNAALLTFNGVLIFGVYSASESNIVGLSNINVISIIILINMIIISCSFLPNIFVNKRRIKYTFTQMYSRSKNYLYYKELSKLNKHTFLKSIEKKYKVQLNENRDYYKDLATQILAIATISRIKYNVFTLCTLITLLVLLILLIGFIRSIF